VAGDGTMRWPLKRVGSLLLLLAGVGLVSPGAVAAGPPTLPPVDRAREIAFADTWERDAGDAAVAGDWRRVARIVQPHLALDPLARWLGAHAALATGDLCPAAEGFASLVADESPRLIAWSDQLVTRTRHKAIALMLQADALARAGREGEAIAVASQAIAVDADLALAYNLRGALRARNGDLDTALRDFTTAIELDPGLTDALANRGLVLLMQDRATAAIDDFTRAIERSTGHAVARHARGIARAQIGDWELAEEDLRAAELDLRSHAWADENHRQASEIRAALATSPPGGGDEASGAIAASITQPAQRLDVAGRASAGTGGASGSSTWTWGPGNMAWQVVQNPGQLFDTNYAKQFYASRSQQVLADPSRGSVLSRGAEATAWDLVGAYIPGKPANQGQAIGAVLFSVTGMAPGSAALTGMSAARTFASSLINARDGNRLGAATDILGLGSTAFKLQNPSSELGRTLGAPSKISTGTNAWTILAPPDTQRAVSKALTRPLLGAGSLKSTATAQTDLGAASRSTLKSTVATYNAIQRPASTSSLQAASLALRPQGWGAGQALPASLGFEKPKGVLMAVQVVHRRQSDFAAMLGIPDTANAPERSSEKPGGFFIPFLLYCGRDAK
jgi:tetratricopeptide (TPR) repeat protein